KEQCNAAFAHRCEVAYITLSSFRVNPLFQNFSLQPTGLFVKCFTSAVSMEAHYREFSAGRNR
ncbi:hypothetical protein, partial [Enterobacter asburiae]|uniref:hypothetical protein n=2 Tax=Enterobacteriaceae TaxID=543 RepID=UPI002A7F707F